MDAAQFYFPNESVSFDYTVRVNPAPAETATATFHRHTAGGATLATEQLQKHGTHTLTYSPSSLTTDDSPVLVKFEFGKANAKKPQQKFEKGFVLAKAEVAEIDVPADAKPGEQLTLKVKTWGARAYARPGRPTFYAGTAADRIQASDKSAVTWKVGDTELADKGESVSYTVPDDAPDTLAVQAYITPPTGGGRAPARATVRVIRIRIRSVVDRKERDPIAELDVGHVDELKAKLNHRIDGAWTWSASAGADKVEFVDREGAVVASPAGDAHRVKGKAASAATEDVTLQPRFKSKATGKEYPGEHKVTVFKHEVKLLYREPTTKPTSETSIETTADPPVAKVEGDDIGAGDLNIVSRDDNFLTSRDSDQVLGEGRTGAGARQASYRAHRGWIESVTPYLPMRVTIKRVLADGSGPVAIPAKRLRLEADVSEGPTDLSLVTEADVKSFVEQCFNEEKFDDGAGITADNATRTFGGRRANGSATTSDGYFATWDGSDLTKRRNISGERGKTFTSFKVPASSAVAGVETSILDLVFKPALTLGDDYKLKLRVQDDPGSEVATGRWTHLKRVRIDAFISIGARQDLSASLPNLKRAYRRGGVIVDLPTAAQQWTLSNADYVNTCQTFFASKGFSGPNAIPAGAYNGNTSLFPNHALGQASVAQTRAKVYELRRDLIFALIDKGLQGHTANKGLAVLYCGAMHPTAPMTSVAGTYMGDKRFALFDTGQTPDSLVNTFAHEMGHATYLRHSYTGLLQNAAGNAVTFGGDNVATSGGANPDDHDPLFACRCNLSYLRPRGADIWFCGLCQMVLRYWNKPDIVDHRTLKDFIQGRWTSLTITGADDLNGDGVLDAAPASVAHGNANRFQLGVVSAVETSNGSRFVKRLWPRATGPTITWTSSAPAIARVDGNGNVTPVRAGAATITAALGTALNATHALTVT